jgi:hypothetical protein
MRLLFLPIAAALIIGSAYAATYYVSSTGSAAWPQCTNAATPCSLDSANQNAQAGDTVYLKGGSYSFTGQYAEALAPAHSGTAGNWITFMNAPGETPEFSGTAGQRQWGIFLEGNSYVRIKGIVFRTFSDSGLIRNNANHIEVAGCAFRDGGGISMVEACAGGSVYTCYVSHLWIHNNTFSRLAAGGGCSGGAISEGGDAVRIGYPSGTGTTQGLNHHISVEDNLMEYGGHAVMDHYGTELVVKNNIMHNEPWYPQNNGACGVNFPATGYTNPAYNGYYGHRNYQSSDDFARDATHNLIEGNRLGHAGVNPNNDGADNMDLASPKNIFRYNSMYGAMQDGLMFKYSASGGGANGGINNRVYSNTIYGNGKGYPFFETCTLNVCPTHLAGIQFYHPTTSGNVIKNNIVLGSRSYELSGHDILDNGVNTIADNFLTSDGDPKFVDPDLSQPTSRTLPDLRLQSSSPAIDGGTYLTQTANSGSDSRTLGVEDALYFQDGTWGSDLARGVTFFPDWIAVGSPDNIAEIKSIDYATGMITLASSISWSDGESVWLFKDSSGRQVLYGDAPDMGAYEFQDSCIDLPMLNGIVNQWLSGSIQINALMDSIRLWKAGC